MINKRQRLIIIATFVLFFVLGLFPPWKYADGQFLGFHPAFNPPPPRADSLSIEDIPVEHVPIQIVPQSLYNPSDASTPDADALRRPYIDIRKMLAVSALLFLGGIVAVIAAGRPRDLSGS